MAKSDPNMTGTLLFNSSTKLRPVHSHRIMFLLNVRKEWTRSISDRGSMNSIRTTNTTTPGQVIKPICR